MSYIVIGKDFSRQSIERFHSRLCKFVGTKEIVYIRKAFNIPHD